MQVEKGHFRLGLPPYINTFVINLYIPTCRLSPYYNIAKYNNYNIKSKPKTLRKQWAA